MLIRNLKDNDGYKYLVGMLQRDLEAIENELELLTDGADKTIALAAKFGAFRRALRVLRDEPDRAGEMLDAWVEANPHIAGGVINGMASYDIE